MFAIVFATGCTCGTGTDVSSEGNDGGPRATGGVSAGQAGGSGGSGAVSSGDGGTGGTSGATISTGGVGGVASDAGPVDICTLSSPTPSTTEQVEHDNLIRSFCTAVIDAGCSYATYGAISAELAAAGCSSEDLIRACMIDSYNDYYGIVTTPECDAVWRAAATCITQARICSPIIRIETHETPQPCDAEKDALSVCWDQANGWVTGSRSFCNYGPVNGQCRVTCDVTAPDYIQANCSGAPGLPLTCDCEVNTHTIWDDGDGMGVRFIAADCRDAALRMADGTCIENLDCCFTWPGPETPPQQHCSCTSDPGKLGYDSCEAAATDRGGQVVDLCPQYKSDPGCLTIVDGGCVKYPPF